MQLHPLPGYLLSSQDGGVFLFLLCQFGLLRLTIFTGGWANTRACLCEILSSNRRKESYKKSLIRWLLSSPLLAFSFSVDITLLCYVLIRDMDSLSSYSETSPDHQSLTNPCFWARNKCLVKYCLVGTWLLRKIFSHTSMLIMSLYCLSWHRPLAMAMG